MSHRFLTRAFLYSLVLVVSNGCSPNELLRVEPPRLEPGASDTASDTNTSAVLAAFGGEYKDSKLKAYINSVAEHVANPTGGSPTLRVTILNTPVVNAFSQGPEQIFVTRGLLALINNESQLAGVLAREIAAHCGPQQDVDSADAPLFHNLTPKALDYLLPCSTEDETRADKAMVKALLAAGYESRAMVNLVRSIGEFEDAHAEAIGRGPDQLDQLSYLATHNGVAAQLNRLIGVSGRNAAESSDDVNASRFVEHLDGIAYGDPLNVGSARGVQFESSKWRARFAVPQGYSLFASNDQVYGLGPRKSSIVFDVSSDPVPEGKLADYVKDVWARGTKLREIHKGRLKQMEAVSAVTSLPSKDGSWELRLFVVRFDDSHLLRVRAKFPCDKPVDSEYAFLKVISSISHLSTAKISLLTPRRIAVVEVHVGDTPFSLAEKCVVFEPPLKFFRALNGLEQNAQISPGARVKLVQRQ